MIQEIFTDSCLFSINISIKIVFLSINHAFTPDNPYKYFFKGLWIFSFPSFKLESLLFTIKIRVNSYLEFLEVENFIWFFND